MACSPKILATVQRRVPSGLTLIDKAGYPCQTQLIQAIRSHYPSSSTYYLWFNIEFNPHSVDLTSRPLHIYEDLDVAVSTRSTGHPKITSFKMKYQLEIDKSVADDSLRRKLKKRVQRVDITWFRPVILKLDLTNIDLDASRQSAVDAGATPGEDRDEYLCRNFPAGQSYVIVE